MYAKIFNQIYDGTLCTNGPWEALVTFQQLLILADQDGNVDMTLPAISRRTTIPLDILERGIAALLEPDPHSRTPTADGRRILPLSDGRSWGWSVTNYKHYRQLKREEDRRAYHRDYWQKRKGKSSTDSTDSTPTQHTQQNQPIAEAEAEAEAEAKEIQPPTPSGVAPPQPKSVRGCRKCPTSFEVNAEMAQWAIEEAPRVNVDRETAKFRDHTFTRAITDWAGAWRNWIRKAADGAQRGGQVESFRERDLRIASERVAQATGGLAHDRAAVAKPLPFERGYIETIEGE